METNEEKHDVSHPPCKRQCLLEEAVGPVYQFEGGLRSVKPYPFSFRTFVKRRWLNRPLIDVLQTEFVAFSHEYFHEAIKEGKIRIDEKPVLPDYVLRDGEQLCHLTILHEPPILDAPITILEWTDGPLPKLVYVNKPCGIPVHPGAAYRYNSLVEILRSLCRVHCLPCPEIPQFCTEGVAVEQRAVSLFVADYNQQALKHLKSGQTRLPEKNKAVQTRNDKTCHVRRSQEEMSGHAETCRCALRLRERDMSNIRPLHRLDRLTSGITVFCSDSVAARHFEQLFRSRAVEKTYLARVVGDFSSVCTDDVPETSPRNTRTLKGDIVCVDARQSKYAFVESAKASSGKEAITEFEFICYDAVCDESLVLCRPKTGRTHQLRAQLLFLGHPISNDPCYGPETLRHLDWFQQVPHVDLGRGVTATSRLHTSGIFLHSWKIKLPDYDEVETLLPDWCWSCPADDKQTTPRRCNE